MNKLGLSTQVPTVGAYISDEPYRKYSWNNITISFMLESTAMVVEELKTLGKERVDDSIISNLKNRLPEAEKGELLEEATGVSEWICLCFLKGWRLNKYL